MNDTDQARPVKRIDHAARYAAHKELSLESDLANQTTGPSIMSLRFNCPMPNLLFAPDGSRRTSSSEIVSAIVVSSDFVKRRLPMSNSLSLP